jgi:2'-5' RNA ligase
VYSCNVPVPPAVSRLARGLATNVYEATPRDRHTLVLKRFGDGDLRSLTRQVRRALEGTPPFEARTAGIELFRNPPAGRGPVAYIRIESPALLEIHETLCSVVDPVEDFEGDDYDPHVTIARGGDAGRLAGSPTGEPITWTVDSLIVWAATYDEPARRISLPL